MMLYKIMKAMHHPPGDNTEFFDIFDDVMQRETLKAYVLLFWL